MRLCQISGPGRVAKKGLGLLLSFAMTSGFVGETMSPRPGSCGRCRRRGEAASCFEGFLEGDLLRARAAGLLAAGFAGEGADLVRFSGDGRSGDGRVVVDSSSVAGSGGQFTDLE